MSQCLVLRPFVCWTCVQDHEWLHCCLDNMFWARLWSWVRLECWLRDMMWILYCLVVNYECKVGCLYIILPLFYLCVTLMIIFLYASRWSYRCWGKSTTLEKVVNIERYLGQHFSLRFFLFNKFSVFKTMFIYLLRFQIRDE